MRKQAWSRRQFLRLAGASSAATVLTACTLPPPPSAGGGRIASEAVQPAAEGLTLSHWQPYSAGQVAAVETFKTQFEDQNSGVIIEFQPISWGAYWEQLAAGIAAGAAPDIFQIPMGLAEEHIARGNIIPVSELVIASADIEENYLTWTVQRGKKGADYYGLPVDVQTLVIYRQNALYEEAGLDPTTPYTDHGDLMQQALALTKKTNGKTIRSVAAPVIIALGRPFSSSNTCNVKRIARCGLMRTPTNWFGKIILRSSRPSTGSVLYLLKRMMTPSSPS
jgi:ABC-type glycerol-3-phosphate transport system substrate-binding protein